MSRCDYCPEEYTHTRKVGFWYQYLCEHHYNKVESMREEEWELAE